MSWEILPDVAWKSAVVLGLTLAVLRLLKNRSAAQRAWVAHIGLFATLALPLAMLLLPRWEVAATPVAQLAAPVNAIFVPPPPVLPAATGIIAPATAALPAAASWMETMTAWMPETATLAALVWGLPTLMLLLAMLVAVARLFALRARAAVMTEQSWLTALALAQVRMNFKHGTALLVSGEIGAPVSWGVFRPVILLGRDMTANEDAEAIIAHELAHVSRLDWAGLLLGRIVTALFWFNPLAWMLARQAHQLREEAADDAVLRSDVDRMDYAALLVGAARHEARGFLLAANGVAPSRGSLKRRIARVLDEHQLRAPAYLSWIGACLLGAMAVALPLAAFTAITPAATAAPVMLVQPPGNPDVSNLAYDPKLDAYAFTSPKADVPVAKAPSRRVLTAQEGAKLHAQAGKLAEDIARREREKLFDLARRAMEQAQAATERERERLQDAAERARDRDEALREQEEGRREQRDGRQDRRAAGESVTIDVPGVFIQATPDGATIRAPGVNIQADKNGADVRVPEYAARNRGASAGKPSANDLIQMAVLGIDRRYREEIANAGYNLSVDQLHQIRIHGMTAGWLQGLAAQGYDRLSLEQIRNIAIHRVTPDFAMRMVQQASTRPTPEQLVQLRIAYGGRMPGEPDKDKNKRKNSD